MFANIITDFMECYDQVSHEAITYIDENYTDTYREIMDELWGIRHEMNLKDLVFFANVHAKLSSPFMHPATLETYALVEDMQLEDNVVPFIELLEIIHEKTETDPLTTEQKQNIVELFLDAQKNLSYVICCGHPEDVYEEQIAFLAKAKKRIFELDAASSATTGCYTTSPNSVMNFVKMRGANEMGLNHLGTTSSMFHLND